MIIKRCAFFFLTALLFATGCGSKASSVADRDTIVTVNNYNITRDEFESEFKASAYGEVDTPESRKDFLNTLIDRKLILQYAQKEGLDKERSFLDSIEKFWEQSLLKIALDQKAREIESQITASDWQTKRTEASKVISAWMSGLRKNAHIVIQDATLKNTAGQEGGR